MYLWFVVPFNMRLLIDLFMSKDAETSNVEVVDKNPMLSSEQEKALEKIGIDPSALPSSVTPEMEKCFIEKLGVKRTNEIKEGASPTPKEVFDTRECYN